MMLLRRTLPFACLTALALAPLPALAHDGAPDDVAKQLADPRSQIAATVALTALSQALLDIRLEPFRRALAAAGSEGAADMPHDARLRDLAGPEAEALPGEIGRRVPQAMGAAAGMVGAVEEMIPELKGMADRMKDAVPHQLDPGE